MNDDVTFAALTGAMEAEHFGRLRPGEVRAFLSSVKSGNGLMLLIQHAVEKDTSRNETAHSLDPVSDSLDVRDVSYYLKLLNSAAEKVGLTDAELKALYLRHQDAI